MRRVSRRSCEDGPLLEEQETEGQRQLHSLLLQQLHTDVDIDRCVAKRQCFAPSALYRPFGEQAAGVRTLSQFQTLQDGEKELASLRELGLTEAEIQLWQSRDAPEGEEKSHGVCAAPGVKQQRLQVIRDKIEARAELLSRPQRFASSRPLSRREMEIEQALFQGNDRLGFLTALYHRDEDNHTGQQGESSSDPLDFLYKDVLSKQRQDTSQVDPERETTASTHRTDFDQSQHSEQDDGQSKDAPEPQVDRCSSSEQQLAQDRPAAPTQINIKQPIRSLCGARAGTSGGAITVRGEIETISDDEILNNRESEDGIRSIPRFRNYQPGTPSKEGKPNTTKTPQIVQLHFENEKNNTRHLISMQVLCVKNLSPQASVAQLVALFSRFEQESGSPVVYRLLTGRMKGQAFITLPDAETAQRALELVHGYRLLGKPLVVEFGRERQEAGKQKEPDLKEGDT